MYVRMSSNGLGWSDIHESPSTAQWVFGLLPPVKMCLEYAGGQQRCFTDAESQIAYDNNCERMNESCNSDGPFGNQSGNVWCCQRGVPVTTSSLSPGYVASSFRTPGLLAFLGLGLIIAGAWFFVSRSRPSKYPGVAPEFGRYV